MSDDPGQAVIYLQHLKAMLGEMSKDKIGQL